MSDQKNIMALLKEYGLGDIAHKVKGTPQNLMSKLAGRLVSVGAEGAETRTSVHWGSRGHKGQGTSKVKRAMTKASRKQQRRHKKSLKARRRIKARGGR